MDIEKVKPLNELKELLEESDVHLICYDDELLMFKKGEEYYKVILNKLDEKEMLTLEKEDEVLKEGNLNNIISYIRFRILKNM